MKIKRNSESQLEQAVKDLSEARRKKADADAAEKLAKEEVLRLLTKDQKKSTVVKDGQKAYKATVVSPERVNIDEESLLVAVETKYGRGAVDEITTAKVSTPMLEQAMEREGQEYSDLVLPFITMKPAAPYVRFTEGGLDDFDAEDPEA